MITEKVRAEARQFVKQYTAIIIGLGRIGQGFDYDEPDDSKVTTHATAYTYHPGFQLLAAVDPDPYQRNRFEAKFQRPAYADLKSLMDRHRPEVFSIAVPVNDHLPVFQKALSYRPRAVLCEKPIAPSTADGRLMQTLAKDHQSLLAVNYMRRFEPGVLALRSLIGDGELGTILKGVAWYSKGLYNNGSHFVDLLRFWLGEVTRVTVLEKGRRWNGQDPEPDVCLYFNQIPVYLLAGREECFSIGEIDLLCSGGKIRYTNSGNLIEIQRASPDSVSSGYTILEQEKQIIPTDLRRYQWHVQDGLYNHLIREEKLVSDGTSATETLAVIERIVMQFGGNSNE